MEVVVPFFELPPWACVLWRCPFSASAAVVGFAVNRHRWPAAVPAESCSSIEKRAARSYRQDCSSVVVDS